MVLHSYVKPGIAFNVLLVKYSQKGYIYKIKFSLHNLLCCKYFSLVSLLKKEACEIILLFVRLCVLPSSYSYRCDVLAPLNKHSKQTRTRPAQFIIIQGHFPGLVARKIKQNILMRSFLIFSLISLF